MDAIGGLVLLALCITAGFLAAKAPHPCEICARVGPCPEVCEDFDSYYQQLDDWQ